MNIRTPAYLASLSGSLLLAAQDRPRELTTEELQTHLKLTAPVGYRLLQREPEIKRSIANQQKSSQNADLILQDFIATVNSPALKLLVQNQPNVPLAPQPAAKEPTMSIHCEGGGFFDGEENLLVFLRNVIVNETRFTLKAQRELKIFFSEKLEEPKKKNKPPKKEEKEEDLPDVNIGNIKTLVATGGIEFSGMDQNGNPFLATAETATYDDSNKKLIIRDGKPYCRMIRGGRKISLVSENKNATILIDLSGEALQVDLSQTGWQLAGPVPDRKK